MLRPSSHAITTPSAHITFPSSHLFHFPPASEPATLIPPVSDHTFARPFTISPDVYNNALHVAVPLSVALVYAGLVTFFNRVNQRREHKPWPVSKSVAFYAFVLTHNVFLAIYSAWTCLGMFNAFRKSWPGLGGRYGVVSAIDSLCKIHGPRGLGSAATYDAESSSWGVTDRVVQLLEGSPDSTDVGRIWNEGLAFYGWLFYISKFYEITDTFIVLAKGKKSSILQTYHHAGAMMCMWAGIRYMSPPIWMFVFINSGLHAAMYTYYTLGTLSLPVPRVLKQTLTTLQITQFIFGAVYAIAHLFIAYSVPVSTPYLFVHNLSTAMPAVASSVSSIVSSATVTAGLSSWLKKAALRAAGEEGLAENVRNSRGEPFGIDAIHASQVETAQKEIRYKLQYQTVQCLDTSGQVFAILLNALYLAPLTWLFINFFARSYIRRVRSASPPPDRKVIAKESSKDAANSLEKEIEEAMAEEEEGTQVDIPPEVQHSLDRTKAHLKNKADDLSSKTKKTAQDTSDAISRTAKTAKTEAEKAAKIASEAVTNQMENAKDVARDTKEAVTNQVENAKAVAWDTKEALAQRTKQAKESLAQRTKDAKESLEQRAKDAKESIEQRTKDAKEAIEQRTKDAKDTLEKRFKDSQEAAEKHRRDAREAYERRVKDAKDANQRQPKDAREAQGNDEKSSKAETGKSTNATGQQPSGETDDSAPDGPDGPDEDSLIEVAEDGDEDNDRADERQGKQAKKDPGPPKKNKEDPPTKDGKPNNKAKGDPKAKTEAEEAAKADAEWDPEDGGGGPDPEAEAYEVKIDDVLNASQKRADREFQATK